jgi:hypothetical protein
LFAENRVYSVLFARNKKLSDYGFPNLGAMPEIPDIPNRVVPMDQPTSPEWAKQERVDTSSHIVKRVDAPGTLLKAVGCTN